MASAAGYLALARLAPARRLVLAIGAATLAWGMLPLAIVLTVEGATGSYPSAGLVVAGFGAAAGISAPFRGRVVDRRGASPWLPGLAAGCAAAVVALAAATKGGAPVWLLVALAAVSGVVAPPLVAYARSVWPQAVEPALVRRGYAVTSLLSDVGLVAGPALAGGLYLLAGFAVLPLCGAILLVASLLALATAARGSEAPRPRPMPRLRSSRALLALLAVSVLLGCALGLVQVAVPTIAGGWGEEELAGPLLAAFALGSVAGALWFGSRSWRGSTVRRYLVAVLALGLLLLPIGLATRPLTLGTLLLLAGLAFGPATVSVFESIDVLAPGSGAEGLTWITTAEAAGWAVGSAGAALLVTEVGRAAPFLLASALLVVPAATLLVLARRVSPRRA
jgi:predicted MFS family arabinose efflux permease